MAKKSTRREFIAQAAAGAALSAGGSLISAKAGDRLEEMINARQAPATGRGMGANDRVNFGFIGMGGRMGAHTGYVPPRKKNKGDGAAGGRRGNFERKKSPGHG